MPKLIGTSAAYALGACAFLLNACASNSAGEPHGASGMSGAGSGAVEPGGASGSSDNGGTAQNAGSGSAAQSAESGSAGESVPGGGGTDYGGTASGGAPATTDGNWGDVTPGPNIFIVKLVFTEGSGPPQCLPRPIQTGLPGSANDGRTACMIVELRPGECDCSQPARAPLPDSVFMQARRQLELGGDCGSASSIDCDTFCGCAIVQAPGLASDSSSQLHACQNDLTPAEGVNGFCEIDRTRTDASGAPAPLGNPALVSECPTTQARLLRFVGAGNPASAANTFIACSGATVQE